MGSDGGALHGDLTNSDGGCNHSETIFRNVLEYSINFDSRYIWIKKVSKRKKKPKLDWVGGLKEYRDQYTALELEKKR
jgi:hypothetical protein